MRRGVTTVVLLLSMMMSAVPAQAKSWTIPRLSIDLTLRPDGSLVVIERRTYALTGAFSHFYQELRLPSRSRLEGLVVHDEAEGPLTQTSSKADRSYLLSQSDDGQRVDWWYQAQDTTRTFILTYRITDAIRMHEDGAELYWQLVGGAWGVETQHVTAALELPGAPLVAWDPSGTSEVKVSGNRIELTRTSLPAETPLELRVLLPRAAVGASQLPADSQTVQQIKYEAGLAQDPTALLVHLFWFALMATATVWFFQKQVRRFPIDRSRLGPPTPLAPAQICALMAQGMDVGYRATLLDLNFRGLLAFSTAPGQSWHLQKSAGVWAAADEAALRVLFGRDGVTTTLTEWSERARKSSGPYENLQKWWYMVSGLPAEYTEPKRYWIYLAALTLLPVWAFTNPSPGLILCLLAAAAGALLGIFQRHLTEEGLRQKAMWEQERARLRNTSTWTTPTELIVGVALGLVPAMAHEPTQEIQHMLQWYRGLDDAFTPTYAYWTASSGNGDGGGGGGGGDGGGGGGAE